MPNRNTIRSASSVRAVARERAYSSSLTRRSMHSMIAATTSCRLGENDECLSAKTTANVENRIDQDRAETGEQSTPLTHPDHHILRRQNQSEQQVEADDLSDHRLTRAPAM